MSDLATHVLHAAAEFASTSGGFLHDCMTLFLRAAFEGCELNCEL